jgi:hypothetical protein
VYEGQRNAMVDRAQVDRTARETFRRRRRRRRDRRGGSRFVIDKDVVGTPPLADQAACGGAAAKSTKFTRRTSERCGERA